MHTTPIHTTARSARKVYQRPQLKALGSVAQLTLKIGSISDGMAPHQ